MQVGTKSTTEGTAIVEQAGKAFADIVDMAGKTSNEVATIAQLMQAQRNGTLKAAKSVDGRDPQRDPWQDRNAGLAGIGINTTRDASPYYSLFLYQLREKTATST